MLIIQNTDKLVGKTLDKKNYYVESIEEQQYSYQISLKSDKYNSSSIIYVARVALNITNPDHYAIMSSLGYDGFIHKKDIRNIDTFIDKLRLVGVK